MSTTGSNMLLTERAVGPGDADYAEASAGFNLLFAHRPAVAVFAQETPDVVIVLVWARQNGLAVRVQGLAVHCPACRQSPYGPTRASRRRAYSADRKPSPSSSEIWRPDDYGAATKSMTISSWL